MSQWIDVWWIPFEWINRSWKTNLNWILLDDCHLQCHHGRKLDANGAELCECIKEEDADDFGTTLTGIQEKEVATIDNNLNDISYVNDINQVPSVCPEVPCSRICPRGFQVTYFIMINPKMITKQLFELNIKHNDSVVTHHSSVWYKLPRWFIYIQLIS